MDTKAFRTKDDAEAYVMQLRDARRDPQTGEIWARDPSSRALGHVYITPCVAFAKTGKRISAFKITFGA